MRIVDYINALPDAYRKDSESNNYKLLLMEAGLTEDFREDIQAVGDTLDIHKATGKTLDLYGEIYRQARGGLTDEQYRYIILQRVARNMIKGDYNSIVTALAVAFGTTPDVVSFSETENPAEVKLESMPLTVMLNAGITAEQFRQMILAVLPAGVNLAPVSLEGTFEFGLPDEYDELKGMGNIEQTIGGYLGMLVTDDIAIPD